jgi:hypothetical protein
MRQFKGPCQTIYFYFYRLMIQHKKPITFNYIDHDSFLKLLLVLELLACLISLSLARDVVLRLFAMFCWLT